MKSTTKILFAFALSGVVFACSPSKEQKTEEEDNTAVKLSEHDAHNQHDHHDHAAHAGHDNANKENPLYDEVISIHDEVMPKMDVIMKLKAQLKATAEGVKDAAEPVNEERKKAIQEIIDELEAADEGMMDWMRNFKPVEGEMDDEAKKYLEAEKVKIIEVRDNTFSAIAKAEKELGLGKE